MPAVKKQMGWIKHAFVFTMRYLKKATEVPHPNADFYIECIQEVIRGGGDTDTNACIVGGMLGALIGYDKLPEFQKQTVLAWSNKVKGKRTGIWDLVINGIGSRHRDQFLCPGLHALKNVTKIHSQARETLEITQKSTESKSSKK